MNAVWKILGLVTAMLLIFFFGCTKENSNIILPPTDCVYPPGNRIFSWRVDTVAWWPSTLGGIWAFSDSDAYVLGSIKDGIVPHTGRLGRHWNGHVWEDNLNGTVGYNEQTGEWGDIAVAPRAVTGDDHFMVVVGLWGISTTTYGGIAEFNNNTKKWKSYHPQSAVGELRAVWTDRKGYFIATGDNGMVYTKDSYAATWQYQKAPTDYSLSLITGVSSNEIYCVGYKSTLYGTFHGQLWKYSDHQWLQLWNDQDSTGLPIQLKSPNSTITGLAAYRCQFTDSLFLYILGKNPSLWKASGQQLSYKMDDLHTSGFPTLSYNVGSITVFSPNDIWVSGLNYELYHWNGSNYQKILPIANFPYGQLMGTYGQIVRNESGKIWMLLEMSSQVFAVVQGEK